MRVGVYLLPKIGWEPKCEKEHQVESVVSDSNKAIIAVMVVIINWRKDKKLKNMLGSAESRDHRNCPLEPTDGGERGRRELGLELWYHKRGNS